MLFFSDVIVRHFYEVPIYRPLTTLYLEIYLFWNPAAETLKKNVDEMIDRVDFSKIEKITYRFYNEFQIRKDCDFKNQYCWDGEFPDNGEPVYVSLRDYPNVYNVVLECNKCKNFDCHCFTYRYGGFKICLSSIILFLYPQKFTKISAVKIHNSRYVICKEIMVF